MFARTSLVAGFIFVGLDAAGCASQSASAIPQAAVQAPTASAVQSALDQPSEPVAVSWVSAQDAGNPTPRASVVRWIGPPPDSLDGDVVRSSSAPPAEAVNRPAIFTTAERVDRTVNGFNQSAVKADKPSLKSNTPPAPNNVDGRLAKGGGASVNPRANQMPATLANASTMPSDGTPSEAMVEVADTLRKVQLAWDNAAKIANDAANHAARYERTQRAQAISVATTAQNSTEQTRSIAAHSLNAVSLESVLEKLPEEFKPLAYMGWDAWSIAKTHNWIQERLAGAEVKVEVEIEGVKLIRVLNGKDPNETVGWQLALTTQPESFRAFGIDSFHWPTTWTEDVFGKRWRGGDVRVPVSEDLAKQARLWRIGDKVVLSGTVDNVVVEGGTTNLGTPCGKFTTVFSDIHFDKLIPQRNRP